MVTAWGTSGAIAAAARPPAPATLATAATARKRRRVVSTGVFVDGMLSMRSAWIMGFIPLVVRVRAGAEAATSPRLAFMVPRFMAKTSVVPKKKRGPAPTGKGIQIGMRWHGPELTMIDDWVAVQSKPYTRPEAIRRLVELGLKAKSK